MRAIIALGWRAIASVGESFSKVRKSGGPEVRKSCGIGILVMVGGLLLGAEPVVGAPAPAGEVDPVTQRRAEEALTALAAAEAKAANAVPAVPMDPELSDTIATIEGWFREIAILLDKNEAAAAGERFLLANDALKALTVEQRATLGRRYDLARERLQGFARTFAE